MFTVKTAIRLVASSDHPIQQYEALHLSRERYALENGLWVKRAYPKPKQHETVFEISGSVEDDGLIEHILHEIECGRMAEPC